MWDEFEDDDIEEEPKNEARIPVSRKASKWMILGMIFEFLSDIAKAWTKLFDTLTDESLRKYSRQREEDTFVQQASREIEMLTSGDYDATTIEASRRIGSRPDEQTD